MKFRFLLCLGLATLGLSAYADGWPQWRGPNNNGHAPKQSIVTEWGPETNVLHKVPMPGPGASTPCIADGKIFMTAQSGTDLVLFAVSTNGEKLWSKKIGTGEGKYRGDEGNMASASCSTDGKRVYAFVGSGTLGAYEFDGTKVWEINIQEKYGKFRIQFGAHWTPVLHDGKLYLQVFHRNAQMLVCINAEDGKEVWQAERPSDSPPGVESPDVYTSPFIWEGEGGPLLIAHGNDYCTAHKISDGSEVWRVTELNPKSNYNRAWRAVSSPLVTDNLIVVPSCKNGVTVAIDPSKADGKVNPGDSAEVWRLPRGTPDVPSPLLVDDILYIMRENGELAGYNVKNGEQHFANRVTNERHRANPLFVDGKLILVGREGSMPVVKPGTEGEVLAKNKLPDTFTASPAAVDGKLYLRGWNYLWVIGEK